VMHWGIGGGWGWGAWLAMVVVMVVFWGAVTWVVVTLVRRTSEPSQSHSVGTPVPMADPLRILDERYARGEVDDEEYHRRRDVLNNPR